MQQNIVKSHAIKSLDEDKQLSLPEQRWRHWRWCRWRCWCKSERRMPCWAPAMTQTLFRRNSEETNGFNLNACGHRCYFRQGQVHMLALFLLFLKSYSFESPERKQAQNTNRRYYILIIKYSGWFC